jgi:hypothetical protein
MFTVNIFLYLLFELVGSILDTLDSWFFFDMILLLWDCVCLAFRIDRLVIFLWIQWEIFRFKLVTENSGSTPFFFSVLFLWFQPLCADPMFSCWLPCCCLCVCPCVCAAVLLRQCWSVSHFNQATVAPHKLLHVPCHRIHLVF